MQALHGQYSIECSSRPIGCTLIITAVSSPIDTKKLNVKMLVKMLVEFFNSCTNKSTRTHTLAAFGTL